MIVLSAILKSKSGKEKILEEELRKMVSLTQNEKGCLNYILHESTTEKGKFFFYEKYFDKESLDFHNSTEHIKKLFSKLDELLEGKPVLDFYKVIDSISR